jgi:hypothetical protein
MSEAELDRITSCAIYPGIGIARVGNSQSSYFIGPEVPGWRPGHEQRFKDEDGRVKRQAARFRIYGLDSEGQVVTELTADEATIEWRVHIANRKAAWYQFQNAMDLGPLAKSADLRNASYPYDRSQLIIDPGERKISGRKIAGSAYRFDTGQFANKPVYLGELRTDEAGRLIVLGGYGQSASYTGKPAATFANNDEWHDDVADGPVRARVILGGRVLEAEPAMVAVTPPNFGPGLYGVVTMYDVVYDLFADALIPPAKPAFWRDIWPIFQRLNTSGGVNSGIWMAFGDGSPSDFNQIDVLARLADPSEYARPFRESLFVRFRNPTATVEDQPALPPFYGDAFDDYKGVPATGLSLTKTQYNWLRAWAVGDFDEGRDLLETCRELEDIPTAEQPHALNRANLESCLGGPFHPGIELTWTLRHLGMWKSPFRLNVLPEDTPVKMDYGPTLEPATALSADGPLAASGPGTLTWWMGVPWQTDEASCMSGYQAGTYLPTPSFWAARVPNEVLPEAGYLRMLDPNLPLFQRIKHLATRGEWLRFFSTQYIKRINSNIAMWDKVGIIAERLGPADAAESGLPERLWVETEVWSGFTQNDPTLTMLLAAEGVLPPQIADVVTPAELFGEEIASLLPGAEKLHEGVQPKASSAHARPSRSRDEL